MSIIPFNTLTAESRFYFIRHGQSVANQSSIIQGHAESPLSRRGRRQAAAAGTWLRREFPGAIYSSPLGRAQETARIIAKRCGLQYTVHESAREIDTGIFSDKSWAEVERDHPDASKHFLVHSWEAVPGAERIASLAERAERYWRHLIETANNGVRRIVTVTHGGILQWILKATMGGTEWMPLIPAHNCGIFMLYASPKRYDAPGTPPARGAYSAWQRVNFLPYRTTRPLLSPAARPSTSSTDT